MKSYFDLERERQIKHGTKAIRKAMDFDISEETAFILLESIFNYMYSNTSVMGVKEIVAKKLGFIIDDSCAIDIYNAYKADKYL